MGKVKQIEIKNRTYHFYNGMINLKNLDKKHYKGINIYYIGYIGYCINGCENTYCVNP